jgi:putative ABC transport system permease protein
MEGFNRIRDHLREDGSTEVTSLLVDTKSVMHSARLENELNEGLQAQAVKPMFEIFKLFKQFVRPMRSLLLLITGMICVVSGVSILVSIYNSMSDRRREIAVMRSLGAGRGTVMAVVLMESVILAMAGGVFGWLSGHALIGLASGNIEERTGVAVSPFDLAPPLDLTGLLGDSLTLKISSELWLVPGLIILAIFAGFLPALSAYRTDVAKALQSSP